MIVQRGRVAKVEQGLEEGCAGERKNKCRCRARYRAESPQTLLSAERFGRQLCVKPTSSTTLEKTEARRNPSGGASTTSFTSLSLFLSLHCLRIHLFVYSCPF